jgi:hypothetical protein
VTKHLKIQYNETILFDGDVDEVVWNDGVNGVTVTGRIRKAGSGGSALIDLLSSAARRQRTESGKIGQEISQEVPGEIPSGGTPSTT